MRLPLVLVLLCALLPMFVGRMRFVPYGLAAQGLALGWIGVLHHGEGHGLAAVLLLAETVLVRALAAPWLLQRAIVAHGRGERELMPANLFTWAIGIALIALAFDFAGAAMADVQGLALGVVGALVAMALLLLAANGAADAQLVALLYMENAIAVFETLLPNAWPWPIHLLLTTVYLLTVAVGSWLAGHPALPATEHGEGKA